MRLELLLELGFLGLELFQLGPLACELALGLAVLAGHEQRCGAVVAGLADRRASLEEQPGALEVAIQARTVQRRASFSVRLVDRRACLE